ncbi:hypothetical protein RhiirA5_148774 [Rhizophagus irregularis]|uniref:Uncharacterized protein n=1 Tax=Rhizophagus irregularis TaxID=588596 RepID=A0A2I1EQ74_9GLOM|nr:hypothetical protein RhiirA5_148774 [Rhizophagus irregularis]PKY24264.1 hypothetical protein RhiirB3_226794 [Rhizophagus irregularis]
MQNVSALHYDLKYFIIFYREIIFSISYLFFITTLFTFIIIILFCIIVRHTYIKILTKRRTTIILIN